MNLVETLKWSRSHGFSISVYNIDYGIVAEIDDLDGLILNAELHCSWEEADLFEKTLAKVMSDLYSEKEGEK